MARPNTRNKYKTIYDAVKAKCKDCSNFITEEVIKCTVRECPLWFYRISPDDIDIEDPEIDINSDELEEMQKINRKIKPKGRSIFHKPIKIEDD